MNLILLHPHEWPAGTATAQLHLHDRRAHHLRTVLQAQPGDSVRIGVIDGLMGQGRILQLEEHGVLLDIVLDTPPPAPLPLTLLLALPRPKVLRRVLQSCTTLGIKQIHLINSYRVEKSYWQTPFLQPEQIREQFLLGLEQARDTVLPQLHLHKRFKPFAEDVLPAIAAGQRCLTAHPLPDSLPCPSGISDPTVLAIGPEGGFIPYEVAKLGEAGFSTIQLGPRILKVETAVPALVCRLFH
ncbi:MAG: 16S rRNA (uracil(1498)-N(3))-methyltransferase [Gammaproteobacteria bacterium]